MWSDGTSSNSAVDVRARDAAPTLSRSAGRILSELIHARRPRALAKVDQLATLAQRLVGGRQQDDHVARDLGEVVADDAALRRLEEVAQLGHQRLGGVHAGRRDVAGAVGELVLPEALRVLVDDAVVVDAQRLGVPSS